MGRAAALLLFAAVAGAAPGRTEADLLNRWDEAGPDERRRMKLEIDRLARVRQFSEARPIVVTVSGRSYTLARLFEQILEPPLRTPLQPQGPNDMGLLDIHRRALHALDVLRTAFEPPHPARAGTLNLLLDYAHRALTARELSAAGRLRFFSETLRNVRALDGRVTPDVRTRWLIHERLLPSLLGVARRYQRKGAIMNTVADAASLLYLPSILDARAQQLLAPLTRGQESRRVLLRAYRQGVLDGLGLVALARSVAARTRGDAAYAAGAPPLILELLHDPGIPARERGELLDAALVQLAPLEPFRDTLVDLCASAMGERPKTLDDYQRLRADEKGPLPRPSASRVYRFLRVVLVQPKPGRPPSISGVVRVDAPFHEPIYERRTGGGRRFVGALAPARQLPHADFVGPAPSLTGGRDLRLLRRTLRLERISIRVFGPVGEFIELCVALPEDRSEPVPVEGANLGHLLDLIEARLVLSGGDDERADLVRLLVRIATSQASALAARHARSPAGFSALLPLAERGYAPAARALVEKGISSLGYVERERAFAAAVRAGLQKQVYAACRNADVSLAALAADALLAAGDVEGIRLLLGHENKYARACATSLALRLTPLAGSLRVAPKDASVLEEIATLCKQAFTKERDSEAWARYAAWLGDALTKPDRVRALRSRYQSIRIGSRRLSPAEFAEFCLAILGDEKQQKGWAALPPYLLAPFRPGRGMTPKALSRVLDAIEGRLAVSAELRRAWRDALVVLACVQHGIEMDASFLKLAHERLAKLAGKTAPPDARRKAGVYWPIWAAAQK